MGKYLGTTGLAYLWTKIKELVGSINYAGSSSVGGTANKAASIPFGTVDSTSTATAFTATVDGITELRDGVSLYLKNTVVTSAAASTAPKCWTLNINNLGAKPVYVTTAEATYSTTQFTVNYKFLFTYDSSLNSGNGGWYIGLLYNTNTTYSTITQAEINAGTGTKARNITPKLLRDNFYTEDEVDTLLGSKVNSNDLATVATSGSYNDLGGTPTIPTKVSDLSNDSGFITGDNVAFLDDTDDSETIAGGGQVNTIETIKVNGTTLVPDTNKVVNITVPSPVYESTVLGWGFTKNSGTYSKPSGGIPKTDLADAVQTSLGKADTALQSFTESDPTVPSHVKGITTTDISNWNGKQATIADLSDIRSGAALGATALQSYTESDPTVPAWAKAANKPSYSLDEVSDGSTRQLPTKVSDLQNDSGFTTNTGTVTSTGGTVAVNNIQVVSALPASPDANTLYLIPES